MAVRCKEGRLKRSQQPSKQEKKESPTEDSLRSTRSHILIKFLRDAHMAMVTRVLKRRCEGLIFVFRGLDERA